MLRSLGRAARAGGSDVGDVGDLSPAATSLSYELGTVTTARDFLHAAAQTLLSLIDGDVVGSEPVDLGAERVEVACFPEDALDEKNRHQWVRETVGNNPMVASYLRIRADVLPRRLSEYVRTEN